MLYVTGSQFVILQRVFSEHWKCVKQVYIESSSLNFVECVWLQDCIDECISIVHNLIVTY